jgi:nitrile hydratase
LSGHDPVNPERLAGLSRLPRDQEPTFHAAWEGRVYALSRVLRARGKEWNLDSFRHGVELLPPADYLRMTYYERWFAWMVAKLVATNDATQTEVDSGNPAPGSPRVTPLVTAQNAPAMVARRGAARRDTRPSPDSRPGRGCARETSISLVTRVCRATPVGRQESWRSTGACSLFRTPTANAGLRFSLLNTRDVKPLPADSPNPTLTVHLTFQYQR